MKFRMKIFVFLSTAALVLAACGGSGDESSSEATQPPSTTVAQGGDDEQTPSSSASEDQSGALDLVGDGETDILGNPAGQGFVEMGGVRYDFVLNGVCAKVFGAVQAAGPAVDNPDVVVDALIPPEDWESDTDAEWDPPYIEVEIDSTDWRAESGSSINLDGELIELTDEQSGVLSFTNDGSRVSGTAVFYNEFNFTELETATGSFELVCP